MTHINRYLKDAKSIIDHLDREAIEAMIKIILDVKKEGGRIFFLGVGGGAGHASHAVNDFRKICGIESYAPTDNVSELTARTNDEGWATVFSAWLKDSRLNKNDAVFVFSVGGGSKEENISPNIVEALEFARENGTWILGIAGRDGGHLAKVADACVVVPVVNDETVTPHTESFQAVIWHLIVSDPRLMRMKNKWESLHRPKVKFY